VDIGHSIVVMPNFVYTSIIYNVCFIILSCLLRSKYLTSMVHCVGHRRSTLANTKQ